MGLIEISRSRFKQYKKCLLTPLLRVKGCLINFWVYLGGDSFSERIGKIRRNKKCKRFNVVLKLEFEVKISRPTASFLVIY